MILYRFRRSSFLDFLRANHLSCDYTLPIETTVTQLAVRVLADMAASERHYQLTHPARSSSHQHEDLGLELLALRNRGQPRPDGHVLLNQYPLSAASTIENLASQRLLFAVPTLCIDNNRFVIRFSKLPLIIILSFHTLT